MSVTIEVLGDDLEIRVQGFDVLLAFKASLHIPLKHIAGVSKAPEIPRSEMGMKLIGAGIPGLIRAGTYKGKDGLTFWDVHNHDKAIQLDLHDERYSRLILEVADPVEVIDRIHKALASS